MPGLSRWRLLLLVLDARLTADHPPLTRIPTARPHLPCRRPRPPRPTEICSLTEVEEHGPAQGWLGHRQRPCACPPRASPSRRPNESTATGEAERGAIFREEMPTG